MRLSGRLLPEETRDVDLDWNPELTHRFDIAGRRIPLVKNMTERGCTCIIFVRLCNVLPEIGRGALAATIPIDDLRICRER